MTWGFFDHALVILRTPGQELTHAVALLQGVWDGSGWGAHWINAAALLALFLGYAALATRVFRWE